MLKIHHQVHLPIPHMHHSSQKVVFSPAHADNDELIQAIEHDAQNEQWQLTDTDGESLTSFWNGVEQDIAKDPEWFSFAED